MEIDFSGVFTYMHTEISLVAVIVIAVLSFLFSIAGCVIGISMGKRFKVNVELLGGIILMVIGIKIFVEHMFFS